MAKINEQWGTAMQQLLEKHGLTYRAAMMRSGGEPSHTTIMDWCKGILPSDLEKVYKFLSAFDQDEAVHCLTVGGLPIPPAWHDSFFQEVEAELSLRGTALTDQAKDEIRALVREIISSSRQDNNPSQ